jgi:hypothetical protein
MQPRVNASDHLDGRPALNKLHVTFILKRLVFFFLDVCSRSLLDHFNQGKHQFLEPYLAVTMQTNRYFEAHRANEFFRIYPNF